MNSDYAYEGELRLVDGTRVIKVDNFHLDLPSEHELLPPTDFGAWLDSPAIADGSITSADIGALIDLMHDTYTQPELCVYVSNHRYWQIKYAQQGKWYPSPRRRKSQARMSKKWRGRA